MSAVMQEMAVTEPKSLSEILVISDQLPEDFYKNTQKYQAELDTAIATAQSLVHDITDEGRKLAKQDAAIIRKYAKTTNDFSLSVFRSLTDKVKNWKDDITGKTKLLEQEADNIMSRFEKIEREKLDTITTLLATTLAEYRVEIGLRPEFYGNYDLSPMVKLSGTLTEGGKLTTKAFGFVKTIADGKLALQNRFDHREKDLKIKCLEADINPPLTHLHLGAVMDAEDKVFNVKVNELITAEIERRAEMERRIAKQNEAANQKKIDDALKAQQEEADRKAKAEHEAHQKQGDEIILDIAKDRNAELNPAPEQEKTPEDLRRIAKEIVASAERAPTNAMRNSELSEATALRRKADELEAENPAIEQGKKLVTITCEFQIMVRSHITPQGVADHLKTKLPADLKAALTVCRGAE